MRIGVHYPTSRFDLVDVPLLIGGISMAADSTFTQEGLHGLGIRNPVASGRGHGRTGVSLSTTLRRIDSFGSLEGPGACKVLTADASPSA
jgi:hypothetical protein